MLTLIGHEPNCRHCNKQQYMGWFRRLTDLKFYKLVFWLIEKCDGDARKLATNKLQLMKMDWNQEKVVLLHVE